MEQNVPLQDEQIDTVLFELTNKNKQHHLYDNEAGEYGQAEIGESNSESPNQNLLN